MTHYEILGIARSATADDIRRAWAEKLREHPPDKDPVGNQRINEAKRTLLDPQARRRYDAQLDHTPEVDALLAKATEAANRGDHAAAAAEVKKAVALAPESDEIRNTWALETMRAGDGPKAVRILKQLVARVPDVAVYQYNLAMLLMDFEQAAECVSLTEALELLENIVEMEPENVDYRLGLARCLSLIGQPWQAEIVIEEIIDEAETASTFAAFEILDAFLELILLHLFTGNTDRVQGIANRIVTFAEQQSEAVREYCVMRILRFGAELQSMGQPRAAAFLTLAAMRLTGDPL